MIFRTFDIAQQTDKVLQARPYSSAAASSYVGWLGLLTARAVLCMDLNSNVLFEMWGYVECAEFYRRMSSSWSNGIMFKTRRTCSVPASLVRILQP